MTTCWLSSLSSCVQEELGAVIEVDDLIDSWVYHVDGMDVLILTYAAVIENDPSTFKISHEHQDMTWAELDKLEGLNLPEGYRRSIQRARGTSDDRESGDTTMPLVRPPDADQLGR